MMQHRSWVWRRRSSTKSAGETESSGSVSSISERFSDEQDMSRSSPVQPAPAIPRDIAGGGNASDDAADDAGDKSLSEKLSAVLLELQAKEDMAKQHAKVAEEAIHGWEKAEGEVTSLKQQLGVMAQRNSAAEDRALHLDAALKECVRQLHRAREEQEQRMQEALSDQRQMWESEKTNLELRLVELEAKLAARVETPSSSSSSDHDGLILKLESLEQENSALRAQIHARLRELELRTVEKDLSVRAAELASKQHLESTRKVARLEAECRRLQAVARKVPAANEIRISPSAVFVESALTDSSSENGELLLGRSSLCASAPSAKSDDLKNVKSSPDITQTPCAGMDSVDDFLELERLVSDTHAGNGDVSHTDQKAIREVVNSASDNSQLRVVLRKLAVAEENSSKLQRRLNLLNGEKHAIESEFDVLEMKRTELEAQLEASRLEAVSLKNKVQFLEDQIEAEKAFSLKLSVRCQQMNALEEKKRETELQLRAAESELVKLSEKIGALQAKLEEERAFSVRLATKCHNLDAVEAKKQDLELNLESKNKEIEMLLAKVSDLEQKVGEGEIVSRELEARHQELSALASKRTELESKLKDSGLQIDVLHDKIRALEQRIREEIVESAELRSEHADLEILAEARGAEVVEIKEKMSLLQRQCDEQLEAAAEDRRKMTSQLESAQVEAEQLREKTALCQEEVLGDTATASALAAKYLPLQVRRRDNTGAGKLAECQKTIASLNKQLKLMSNFDEYLLEDYAEHV